MIKIHNSAIVSQNTRIRKGLIVGRHSIIDDFCYVSCKLVIGHHSHIGANCTFLGGKGTIYIGDFVNIAPGCRIISASHDYAYGGLTGPTIPEDFKGYSVTENVHMENHVLIGCNVVILPGTKMPIGMAVGALSLVPKETYKSWTLYAGIPIKEIGPRCKAPILEGVEKLVNSC